MPDLRLYAVGIDEVRDMLGAPGDIAARLRTLTLASFPPPPPAPPSSGLLGKLGPLFKRPLDLPTIPRETPTRADAEALLGGRFVPLDRLAPSWVLLRSWMADAAWATLTVPLAPGALDALDFDLARAGVASHFAVRRLWSRDARLGLQPLPGQQVGYLRHDAVLSMADAWSGAIDRLEGASRETAETTEAWLARFPDWADAAAEAGRSRPDLVAVYGP